MKKGKVENEKVKKKVVFNGTHPPATTKTNHSFLLDSTTESPSKNPDEWYLLADAKRSFSAKKSHDFLEILNQPTKSVAHPLFPFCLFSSLQWEIPFSSSLSSLLQSLTASNSKLMLLLLVTMSHYSLALFLMIWGLCLICLATEFTGFALFLQLLHFFCLKYIFISLPLWTYSFI